MDKRNTIQKSLVLNAVRELRNHATADEIHRKIAEEHPTVSRGTVYRNLNGLAEDGEILKIEIPGEAERFDHNCTKHYHVRCIRCNEVSDVDMDCIPDILDRIRDSHGTEFIDYDIVFRGICRNCAEKPEKASE